MADTVDEISGGRLILGLGAGDYEDEHRAFGMRWDHRVSRFAEALAIIHPLLRHGRVDFAGEYYQARDCELRPRGPRPAGPPILIGALAHGPRMLDLTARYADVWNGWIADRRTHPDVVPPLREAVDAACRAVGRDPATLGRSLTVGVAFGGRGTWGGEPLTGSAEEIAAGVPRLRARGDRPSARLAQPGDGRGRRATGGGPDAPRPMLTPQLGRMDRSADPLPAHEG